METEKTIDKILKTMLSADNRSLDLENLLVSFVKQNGGFVYFDYNPKHKFPDCPMVRLIELREHYEKRKTEPAYEHLVQALKYGDHDIMLFTVKFRDSDTQPYFSKDEVLNTSMDDPHWHSLRFGDEVLFYDTASRICQFLIDHQED